MFLDYLNSQDKKKKEKELPDWYQQSALGQFAQQQQDRANQWFGDVLGVKPETDPSNPLQQYTNPITQYGDQLKQQGREWFMQTPIGEGVNDFYSGFFHPMQSKTSELQKGYQAKLKGLYDNGR